MHRTLHYCAAALALLALAEGFSPAAVGGSALLGRRLRACPAGVGAHGLAPLRAARRPARRGRCGGLAMQTGESSATKNIIVGVLAFGFLFGALFPLINNGLRIGTAGDEMSGAATGMRQKELDERLAKVHRRPPRRAGAAPSFCRLVFALCALRPRPRPLSLPSARR
jgi:hypothetical protein